MVKKYTRKGHKTRSAGRFGVRYGRKNRKLVADIEERMRQGYKCPECGMVAIRRIGTGIWNCKKCDHTFAGGTYQPYSSVGLAAIRSVKKAMEPDMLLEQSNQEIPIAKKKKDEKEVKLETNLTESVSEDMQESVSEDIPESVSEDIPESVSEDMTDK
ncbi:MAG: 50S ribosomal protein L37ae [Methanosarcinales archaeon]|nr:50S ribosomal protein L37ae [Methanosarcinales archaeon]